MEVLEIGLEALHDLHRVIERRLDNVDLLEPAHQRAVLFKELAKLLVGGRTDAADGAVGERRLEQVGGIHRPAGRRTGTDDGMDLVDEQDRAVKLFEFLDDLFQPFLEIATIARARDQRAHVEREDGGVGQHFVRLISSVRPISGSILPPLALAFRSMQ